MLNVYVLTRNNIQMQHVIVTRTDAAISVEELYQIASKQGSLLVLPATKFDETELAPNRQLEILTSLNSDTQPWAIAKTDWFFDCPQVAQERRRSIEAVLDEHLPAL